MTQTRLPEIVVPTKNDFDNILRILNKIIFQCNKYAMKSRPERFLDAIDAMAKDYKKSKDGMKLFISIMSLFESKTDKNDGHTTNPSSLFSSKQNHLIQPWKGEFDKGTQLYNKDVVIGIDFSYEGKFRIRYRIDNEPEKRSDGKKSKKFHINLEIYIPLKEGFTQFNFAIIDFPYLETKRFFAEPESKKHTDDDQRDLIKFKCYTKMTLSYLEAMKLVVNDEKAQEENPVLQFVQGKPFNDNIKPYISAKLVTYESMVLLLQCSDQATLLKAMRKNIGIRDAIFSCITEAYTKDRKLDKIRQGFLVPFGRKSHQDDSEDKGTETIRSDDVSNSSEDRQKPKKIEKEHVKNSVFFSKADTNNASSDKKDQKKSSKNHYSRTK